MRKFVKITQKYLAFKKTKKRNTRYQEIAIKSISYQNNIKLRNFLWQSQEINISRRILLGIGEYYAEFFEEFCEP